MFNFPLILWTNAKYVLHFLTNHFFQKLEFSKEKKLLSVDLPVWKEHQPQCPVLFGAA